MQITVIGGGIGGLALAAGLRRHGVDVTVHERDVDPAATGGYHLTLDGAAQRALARLLAPADLDAVFASASAVRRRDPDVWWDHRGRALGRLAVAGHDPDSVDVDRRTLRVLLARAVGADLRLGRACTAVHRRPDGARAVFADGGSEDADLVVGADGPGSVVARTLAGRVTHRPAGLVGVSGRTPADALEADDRERLGRRSSLAVGPRGSALYVGYLDPVGFAVLDAPDRRAATTLGPTYIWGAMVPAAAGAALLGRRGADLRDATLALLRSRGWAERPLQVVARTGVDDVACYPFLAGPADARDAAPWPAGRITALGDAVHATPPTAGKGAGTAIVDAAALVDAVLAAREGRATLDVAVAGFEADMRRRGSEVVALSLRTVDRVLATSGPVASAASGAALSLLAAGVAVRARAASHRTVRTATVSQTATSAT